MATLKTKFRVYSVRSKEEGSPTQTIGLSQVRDLKEDETSFGGKSPWGELAIDAESGSDASEAFKVGDIVTVSIKTQEKEDAAPATDADPNKPKK